MDLFSFDWEKNLKREGKKKVWVVWKFKSKMWFVVFLDWNYGLEWWLMVVFDIVYMYFILVGYFFFLCVIVCCLFVYVCVID